MRVKLLDLSDQYRALEKQINSEIHQVFASQRFIVGPKGEAFEQAMASYCGAPYAVGVSSGTDALLALAMALGIGRGDGVITSAYSFFATGACFARTGATPIFVDIDPATFNLSPDALTRFLETQCRNTKDGLTTLSANSEKGGPIRIRAVMPVHLFGLCCNMPAIMEIAAKYNLSVLEDAAQAIGAECIIGGKSRRAGTIGEAGCFSFYPSKNLGAAGDAGLVICHDPELAARLRICREHGMGPRYYHHFIGGNFRLDEIQAAVLKVKLPYLDKWSKERRAVADFYREEFGRAGLIGKLVLPAEPYRDRGLTNHHIYHQFVVRTERRDELKAFLATREIETAIYYPLGLHQQECFAYLGYKPGDLPETERAARESLALPIYPQLPRDAQRYVVHAIAEFFEATAQR